MAKRSGGVLAIDTMPLGRNHTPRELANFVRNARLHSRIRKVGEWLALRM
jgi:hypothetical protein